MDAQTQRGFESIAVLLAQADCRLMALQATIQATLDLNEDQKQHFACEVDGYYKIFLRRKIEAVEDVDPELAIRLQRLLRKRSTGQRGG